MYSISTVHVSLSLKQSLVAFFEQNATNGGLMTFNDPGSPWLVGQTSLELVNVSFNPQSSFVVLVDYQVSNRRLHCRLASMGLVGRWYSYSNTTYITDRNWCRWVYSLAC